MAFDRQGFVHHFVAVRGKKETSAAGYLVNLKKIDGAIGGLDEYVQKHGVQGTRDWLTQNAGLFKYPSDTRSAFNGYASFLNSDGQDALVLGDEEAETGTPAENAATVFQYENELQRAVRAQLGSVLPGSTEADDGYEASVASGRTDILARSVDGRLTVIELKAGKCPKGAVEQVLGYAQDLSDDRNEAVDAVLIAGDFSPRIRSAAKRIPGLKLKVYSLAVQLSDVD